VRKHRQNRQTQRRQSARERKRQGQLTCQKHRTGAQRKEEETVAPEEQRQARSLQGSLAQQSQRAKDQNLRVKPHQAQEDDAGAAAAGARGGATTDR
jgi:hypothetical protein